MHLLQVTAQVAHQLLLLSPCSACSLLLLLPAFIAIVRASYQHLTTIAPLF